jgi:hypothetical protein
MLILYTFINIREYITWKNLIYYNRINWKGNIMGIKSTVYIKRKEAIDRITEVTLLIFTKNYRKLEQTSFEPHENIQEFVDNWKIINVDNLEKWTDSMLGDYMDNPFFRRSMFDNYLIRDEED